MNRRAWAVVAIVAIAALAYGSFRFYHHERGVEPAIITPAMNARELLSPPLSARVARVLNNHFGHARPAAGPKLIALTFDDGPYPIFTPLLLDQLNKLHVPATFFLIGRDAQQWPQLAQRIEAAGDEIADHTYSHPDLDLESRAQVRREILQGRDVLYGLVHDPSVRIYFRPPHGRYTVATIEVAQGLGYQTILWTDDSGDWRTVTPAALLAHLERFATAPEIVLLHSGRLATIQALPTMVARFESAGYQFVTVRELLAKVSPARLNHPAKHPV